MAGGEVMRLRVRKGLRIVLEGDETCSSAG